MSRLITCIAMLVFASSIALAKLPQQPNSRESADTAELTRLENVWNEAHLRGDADALDRLWADDLIVQVTNMRVLTKPEAIGMVRSGHVKFRRYETSNVRIRVYENAAVVTGRLERTRDLNGRNLDDTWRFTKVYIRRAPGWQVVAFHASTIEQ